MLRFWLLLIAGLALSSPAAAQRWVNGETPELGLAAALTDHPVLPIVLLVCQKEQMFLWVRLDENLPQPAKEANLVISLQGHDAGQSFLKVYLAPTQTPNEYIGPAEPLLVDLLMSKNQSLWFSYSIDGGTQFSRGSPDISLIGSTIAVGKTRAACDPNSAIESDVRIVVKKGYDFYKLPFGSAPDTYPSLAFSADLARRIENTDDGHLGYDPFCMCQDFDEAKFFYAIDSITVDGPNRATVKLRVAAVGGMKPEPVQLVMIKEGGNWVVDDIIDGQGSLRAALR